jgi:hypothetical protein
MRRKKKNVRIGVEMTWLNSTKEQARRSREGSK